MNQDLAIREPFSSMFARIDCESPSAIAWYIRWLCGYEPKPNLTDLLHCGSPTVDHIIEALWRWDAPRHRAAKLLWQQLQGNYENEYFRRRFTPLDDELIVEVANCKTVLLPIQEKLRWILAACTQRREHDVLLGQGNWGEEWWLPTAEAVHVRQQLSRARVDLIERPSDYADALRHVRLPYFRLPTSDDLRSYVGKRVRVRVRHGAETREETRACVFVEDIQGTLYPLPHARFPFADAAGFNFGWGYGGYGPTELARSVLADACGGDLEVGEQHDGEFVHTVLASLPHGEEFRLERKTVLDWLSKRGINGSKLAAIQKRVINVRTQLEPRVLEYESRLEEIEKSGGLVAQRFDLVPPDFECALYIDLMRFLEKGGWILHCSRCGLSIPCDNSPRGNRQRSRWTAGQQVYHEQCFRDRQLERKRQYWSRRIQDNRFRESERQRARNRRRHARKQNS